MRKAEDGRRADDRLRRQIERLRPQLERWEALCAELGARADDLALAWLLRNPAVTAPVIGPRTVEQLDDSLSALTLDLEADVLAQLDDIFPGPGGAAPEAYAW
jgi:aryl-alcohol dehydrogenase-like predicted oxidoreductase